MDNDNNKINQDNDRIRISPEELELSLSTDQKNQLAHQFRGEKLSKRVFKDWYINVIEPIKVNGKSINEQLCWFMFIGSMSIEEFTNNLNEEFCDAFIEQYPKLQANYTKSLELN